MLKKILYILGALLFALFIYFNYFKEDSPLNFDLSNIIETRGVVYRSKDYKLRAETQIDDIEKKETSFEKAKAIFKNMSISSDSAMIDTLKNLVLHGNIVGVGKNGWNLNANKARYSSTSEKLYSEGGVHAYNEEKKIAIYGDKFESDKKMEDMILSGNIRMESQGLKLKGEEAHYNNSTELLEMDDGIEFSAVQEDGGTPVTGSFDELEYDGKKKLVRGWGNVVAKYNGIEMMAEEFIYYEDSGDFELLENLKAVGDDLDLGLKKIYYDSSKKEMLLYGEIKGKSGEYSFSAANGVYYLESKLLVLNGKVSILGEKGDTVKAELIEYNTDSGVALFSAPQKGVVEYISGKERLSSKNFRYNLKSKEISTESSYRYSGEKYSSTGDSINYNTEGKKGVLKGARIEDGKNLLRASEAYVDFTTSKHVLSGDVFARYDGYEIRTERADIDEIEELIRFDRQFELKQLENGVKLSGSGGYYSAKDKFAKISKDARVSNTEYTIKSNRADYDLEKGEAQFVGDVQAKDVERGYILRSDSGKYKKDQYISLDGGVEAEVDGYKISSDSAKYDSIEELLYLPGKVKFSDNDISGEMNEGYYDSENKTFSGRNFYAVPQGRKLSGENGRYYSQGKILELSGNVLVRDGEMEGSAQSLRYYNATSYAVADKGVELNYSGISMDSHWAEIDMEAGKAHGGEVVFRDVNGQNIKGNRYSVDFKDNVLKLSEDVSGTLVLESSPETSSDSEELYFKSGILNLFLKKESGKYTAYKSELRNSVDLDYGDLRLSAQELLLNHISREAEARGGSKLEYAGGNEILSDNLNLISDNQIAVADGNVSVKSVSEEAGEVYIKSDKAKYDNLNKKAEFTGNVVLEKGGTTMWADETYYDLKKEQVKGKGNVFVEHLSDVESEKKKEEAKKAVLLSKIKSAMLDVQVQEFVGNDKAKIELTPAWNNVNIQWESSDAKILSGEGKVRHPKYTEGDAVVKLTGTFTSENMSRKKDYYISVEKESKKEYLKRELSAINIGSYPIGATSVNLPEKFGRIKVEWESLGSFIDSTGKIVAKLKNGPVLKGAFNFEDQLVEKTFSALIGSREFKLVSK